LGQLLGVGVLEDEPGRSGAQRGRVRAAGTHAELLVQDQLYAQLAATQLLTPA
jgi:hypothetical protein